MATPRLLFIIPAHNEAGGISRTVASILEAQRYPADRRSVVVLADNCVDATAAVATAAGATVFERTDPVHRGKGQALNWLFSSRPELLEQADAIAIIDADTLVDPGFAQAVSASLADPAVEAVQAFGSVANPQAGWRPALLEVALAVFHHLRPAGSMVLGGSASLKGNGIVLRSQVLKRTGWPAFSIVEDIEFGILLAKTGLVVHYNPQAVVRSEMASRSGQAAPQRDRWEGGRFALLRHYGPALLRQWVGHPSRPVLDALLDLLLPPLSILVLWLAVLLPPAWFFGRPLFWTLLAALTALALHVVAGMLLRGVSPHAWLALLASPFYLLWKLPLYLRMLLGGRGRNWHRTVRQHELAASAAPPWPVALLLGLPVHPLTLQSALDFIFARVAEPGAAERPGLVTTINVDFLVNALSWFGSEPRHPELTAVLRRPLLSTADGMPLVWAGRLLGAPLPARVAGSDLVPALAARAAQEGRSLYLLGGRREVAEEAAEILRRRHPGLRIAGIDSPMVHTEGRALAMAMEEDAAVCERINAAAPDILLIGFGNPKQELWFERNRHRLRVPVAIGVGGTFNFITGRVKRAPAWMRETGLEWVYRIQQEPGRLWKRYGIGALKLVLLLLPAVVVYRMLRLRRLFSGRTPPGPGGMTMFIGGSTTQEVIQLPPSLEAANAGAFLQMAQSAFESGPLVVDARNLAWMDAAGLGAFLEFWERTEASGRSVLCFGLRPGIRWMLKINRIHDYFEAGLCGSVRELVARLRVVRPGCRGLAAVDAGGQVRILRFLGELGSADLAGLESAGLASLLAGMPCVIDLGLCTRLDTAGIGLLEAIRRRCEGQGMPCIFCNLSGPARQAVRTARLDEDFFIVGTVGQALALAKLKRGVDPCV